MSVAILRVAAGVHRILRFRDIHDQEATSASGATDKVSETSILVDHDVVSGTTGAHLVRVQGILGETVIRAGVRDVQQAGEVKDLHVGGTGLGHDVGVVAVDLHVPPDGRGGGTLGWGQEAQDDGVLGVGDLNERGTSSQTSDDEIPLTIFPAPDIITLGVAATAESRARDGAHEIDVIARVDTSHAVLTASHGASLCSATGLVESAGGVGIEAVLDLHHHGILHHGVLIGLGALAGARGRSTFCVSSTDATSLGIAKLTTAATF
jgi:hypothetical protein